ncbi:uncharacterized protein YndB with AHSA1/START domain [Flavobacteriaceae bacterium MAR_2010_72]|nr:uncharacterized protein YndB with AHSA1/START domain [Flavobacteriaceae bacterium MAR_2010_72]
MKTSDPPIFVEQVFNRPIDEVWEAITKPNQMKIWFFENIPDFKAKVGFKTRFNVQAPSRDFMHCWEIIEVIPNHKIVYKWSYEGLAGDSLVIFELVEIQNKTKLILTTKIIDDFDDSIPEFQPESCQNGWNYFIKERLANYLS